MGKARGSARHAPGVSRERVTAERPVRRGSAGDEARGSGPSPALRRTVVHARLLRLRSGRYLGAPLASSWNFLIWATVSFVSFTAFAFSRSRSGSILTAASGLSAWVVR